MFATRHEDTSSMSKIGPARMNNLRHNPYVGFYSHSAVSAVAARNATNAYNQTESMLLGNQRNPLIGTFRHSPPVNGPSAMGLKGLLIDRKPSPVINQLQLAQSKYKNLTLADLKLIPVSKFITRVGKGSSESSGCGTGSHEGTASSPDDCPDDTPLCAICLDCFRDGDDLRTLQCSHCYHKRCIDVWLLGIMNDCTVETTHCPKCRQHAVPIAQTQSHSAEEVQQKNIASNIEVQVQSAGEELDPVNLTEELTSACQASEDTVESAIDESVTLEHNESKISLCSMENTYQGTSSFMEQQSSLINSAEFYMHLESVCVSSDDDDADTEYGEMVDVGEVQTEGNQEPVVVGSILTSISTDSFGDDLVLNDESEVIVEFSQLHDVSSPGISIEVATVVEPFIVATNPVVLVDDLESNVVVDEDEDADWDTCSPMYDLLRP